jgi:poly [ADP-ribose] polymerase
MEQYKKEVELINNYTIDPKVVYFLNLISNEEIIDKFLKNMGIDSDRMQISKINKKRITRASEILFQLQNEIQNQNFSNISELSGEYERYIPYSSSVKLDNINLIKNHIDNIEIIENMYETYETIIKNKKKNLLFSKHVTILNSLNVQINILSEEDIKYKELVEKIISKSSHKYKNIQIYFIYDEKKENEYKNATKDIADKRLLYHGSPITNWFSIIKNGLYINPKKIGVNINGKVHGNGVYFSDDINYSYNYCIRGSNGVYNNNMIIMGMYDVALCDKSYKKSPIFVSFNTSQCILRYLILLSN